jgi:hypothetical protein
MPEQDDGSKPWVWEFESGAQPELGVVRNRLAVVLVDLTDESRDGVLLVSTELLTNAFQHAVGPWLLRVWRSRTPDWVRVEVCDHSLTMPRLGVSAKGEIGGWGLLLVAELSQRWGVERTGGGKTVWAQVSCDEHRADRD